MQQRRVRLGDVLDDYCPRERRVTNHAVVAMIEDEVKQTRCTTCDTEHEYKHARVPASRRKKPVTVAAVGALVDVPESSLSASEEVEAATAVAPETAEAAEASPAEATGGEEVVAAAAEDEWPVHRPLIRATLPRPEGQTPERKAPDFTFRQTGGRFDAERDGNRARGNRHGRHAHGSSHSRFGTPKSPSGFGSRGAGQQPGNHRHGNRQGPPSGQRRSGHGGDRPGHGRGPKRGR